MQIWKYKLEVTDEQTIEMPRDAKILTVQTQHDDPCIWVAVIPSNVKVQHKIRIAGTGHSFQMYKTAQKYIGTFQMSEGTLIYHVFDAGEEI